MRTKTLLFPLKEILNSYHVGLSWHRSKVEPDQLEAQRVRIIMNADFTGETLGIPSGAGQSTFIKRSQRLRALQPSDVIVTLKFIEFAVAIVPGDSLEDNLPCYTTNNAAVLHPNPDVVLPAYLALWLRSRDGQEQIDRIRTMTTKAGKLLGRNFSSMTLTDLVKIIVPVPLIERQLQIVQEYEAILEEKEQFLQKCQSRMQAINTSFDQLRS